MHDAERLCERLVILVAILPEQCIACLPVERMLREIQVKRKEDL